MKYQFRVSRDKIVLEFADELKAKATVELLGALVEGRDEQEEMASIAVTLFGECQELCSNAMTSAIRRNGD